MAVLPFLTKAYAQNVYIFGNRKFDGGVPVDYHQSIKEHAVIVYSDDQIKAAYTSEYITEDEYVETMQIREAPAVE
ncbi:hypothetical protein [Peribacillus loiseleuriae]|uniref:Uncharacterized protein n=1 Tax=Peribacillus loiseleuriae TaxID=1679170 RepID=A0A0K9GQV5_9BACI|nr:hypothetical protein [Peribacillus loiseleuriae]KMY49030.1 hypothetical protein AC625_05500 [Peribacillus loiseleuriae]